MAALTEIATADTFTFTGGGSTNNWSDSGNWQGGLVPTNDGTADVVLASSASGSNVDIAWLVNSVRQSSGAAYTLSTSTGVQLQVNTQLDNASSSVFTIAGSVASPGFNPLNFNSGTFRVTGLATSAVNVAVTPAASLYVSASGTISSLFGQVSVGQFGGVLGGAGTMSAPIGSVVVRGPDGGALPAPTLVVGDPYVNGGVGTLIIDSPTLFIGSSDCNLDFTFGGGDHSLVTANGNLNLSQGNIFNIASLDGTSSPGEYTLIAYAGDAVTEDILATQTLNLPTGWEGNLFSTAGVLGVNVTAVPEPQTWGMLGLGLAGMILARRCKRAPSA